MTWLPSHKFYRHAMKRKTNQLSKSAKLNTLLFRHSAIRAMSLLLLKRSSKAKEQSATCVARAPKKTKFPVLGDGHGPPQNIFPERD